MTIRSRLSKIENRLTGIEGSVCNREQQCLGVSGDIKKFIDKVEHMVFGNGEPGIKTQVALLEADNINIKANRTEDKKEIDCLKKKVKKVSDRVLINSTKMYAYSGAIALFVSLLAIFVPLLWR